MQNVTLAYDEADRRTSVTLPNGIQISYAYDDASQLTGITYRKSDGSTIGNLTYAYDAAGRRIRMGGSLARTTLPAAVASAAYDANNRLTNWGGLSLTYDDNGNLIGEGTATYTWNARNQLAAASQGAASCGYDAAGRRRSRTVSGIGLQTLHDGWNPIQLKQAGAAVESRLYGMGLDEIYGRTNSGASQSYLTDALGSVLELANADQTAQADYTYGAYGQTSESPPGASSNLIRYTGREQDTANLYYYRNRYYSPGMSRFISEDPIGLAGGVNLYQYVGGDPLLAIDPMGYQASFLRNPMFDEVWRNLAPDKSGQKPQPFDWQSACWKATCRDCEGNLFEIDYLDNSKGIIRDPGKLWPPSPSTVPDNCWCTKSGGRPVGGPPIPPGL